MLRYKPTPMMHTMAGTPQTKLFTAVLIVSINCIIGITSLFYCLSVLISTVVFYNIIFFRNCTLNRGGFFFTILHNM